MEDKTQQLELFARCASGFEGLLATEIKALGARQVRPLTGGVAFVGSQETALRACLWLRIATRVQLVLARIGARTAEELYEHTFACPWDTLVADEASIAVHAHGRNDALRNSQFTALKIKDAICDSLRSMRGTRPDVNSADPDFALDVSLNKNRATLYLNLSGPALHRRGYRADGQQTEAPLKETLAAGIVLAAGWGELCQQWVREGADSFASSQAHNADAQLGFVDPLCGSGTLALEAALVAADCAPGILRTRWGFTGWAAFDESIWVQLVSEAQERKRRGLERARERCVFIAGDSDAKAVEMARANAQRAGVADLMSFKVCDAADLLLTTGTSPSLLPAAGLLATNPPYGQRLNASGGLAAAYHALGNAVSYLPDGWRLAVITPDTRIDTALGFVPSKTTPCYNGPLEVQLRSYEVVASQRTLLDIVSLAGVERSVAVAEPNSAQFAARLRKVAKERARWARKEGITNYRIYDADLPDYACSIDLFEESSPAQTSTANHAQAQRFVRVAEYQAPASIDPALADRRFADTLALVSAALDVPDEQIFSKVRKRAKGGSQYREARAASRIIHVQEGGYTFELDLNGRLDVGLFLDHRSTRQMLADLATGKRFLNLFAYTGTASVYAAGGGAASTITVDLSRTYLDWARRNMAANGFTGSAHDFVQASCDTWLDLQAQAHTTYDLVFCDPPTFSNSKAMQARSFDVQRDHASLIQRISCVLAPGGTIVFSCNLHAFKLDFDALAQMGLAAENITARTIPHDFSRTPQVHHCFLIRPS